jgi:bacterioferritin-associated ferredoxin
MYVCICNALNEHQVDATIARGAHSARAVFQALECRPRCRMCVAEIRERIMATTGESASANDLPAGRLVYGCREAEILLLMPSS